jgi:DNA-binding GntR family transcriptional regulator
MNSDKGADVDRRIAAPPTMSVLAAEALRSMILSGELLPGDRLPENSLTAQLGVSRSPLREAMSVLEQEGLIVQAPRRGAVVAPLTVHDIYEIYTLREQLEELAIRLGVPVLEESRLDRLRPRWRRRPATTRPSTRASRSSSTSRSSASPATAAWRTRSARSRSRCSSAWR